MHRIVAFILSAAMVGCSISVFADTKDEIRYDELDEWIVSEGDIVAGGHALSTDDLGESSENGEDDEMDPNGSDKIGSEGIGETENEVISDNVQEEHENADQVVSDDEMDDVSVNSVSTNDGVNERISDGQEEKNGSEETKIDSVSEDEVQAVPSEDKEKKEQGSSEDAIISKVKIPTKVHVDMDIDEVRGEGKISSEQYDIVNHGNRDIAIKIKNLKFSYRLPKDTYEINGEVNKEISAEEHPKTKKIDVDIIWENEDEGQRKVLKLTDGKMDEYVLYLKAARYDKDGKFKSLDPGSKGTFRFVGSVESEPGLEWKDKEISLGIDYEIENMGEQENREEVEGFIQNALAAVEEDIQPNEEVVVGVDGNPNTEIGD